MTFHLQHQKWHKFRIVLIFFLIIYGSLVCGGVSGSFAASGDWHSFKDEFISKDGRVIDYKQQGISHSEGQGYAMLLAVFNEDLATFKRLWQWTQENLQVRDKDALMCWSWGQRFSGEWSIIDYNNASDGDICIAYALLLGSKQWQVAAFKEEGLRIVRSIQDTLIIKRYGVQVVLPAYYGFMAEDHLIVNPSYWVFPAFRHFAEYQDQELWLQVHGDALGLIKKWTFSDLQLPPDWLHLSEAGGTIAADKNTLCGYEAIRVFLFMDMDHLSHEFPGIVSLLNRIEELHFVPLPLDLEDNAMSLWGGPAGFYAVMARCAESLGRLETAKWLQGIADTRLEAEHENYYSYVLYLLAEQRGRP